MSVQEPQPAPQAPYPPTSWTPRPEPRFEGRLMAGWGYRAGGFVVDVACVVFAGLAVGYLAKAAGATNGGANALGSLTGIAAWFIDTVLIFGRTRGRSVGKLVAGTRVVRENRKPARYLTGFVRETLCRLLYFVPFFGLVDIFMPLGSERQSLRDKMLHTRVLREPGTRRDGGR